MVRPSFERFAATITLYNCLFSGGGYKAATCKATKMTLVPHSVRMPFEKFAAPCAGYQNSVFLCGIMAILRAVSVFDFSGLATLAKKLLAAMFASALDLSFCRFNLASSTAKMGNISLMWTAFVGLTTNGTCFGDSLATRLIAAGNRAIGIVDIFDSGRNAREGLTALAAREDRHNKTLLTQGWTDSWEMGKVRCQWPNFSRWFMRPSLSLFNCTTECGI